MQQLLLICLWHFCVTGVPSAKGRPGRSFLLPSHVLNFSEFTSLDLYWVRILLHLLCLLFRDASSRD